MISKIAQNCLNRNLLVRSKQFSTNVTRRKPISFKKTLFYGTTSIISGFAIYDAGFRGSETLGGINRFLRSLKIAIQISTDYSIGLYGLIEDSKEYDKELKIIHKIAAERLLEGCLKNGGLYIKIGQGISAINHILPVEYTDTLKKLEDTCITRNADEVDRLFLEDFGETPDKLFAEFNYTPIAAASLAQVFVAKTKDNQDVAVKVQYIDLQKRFRGDLGTILFLQDIVALVHKNYNFGWILRDVRKSLELELDFINEAKNSEKCAEDLKNLSFLHVPKVHWELTKTRVLTAELIDDACKISDLAALNKQKISIKEVDKKLFEIFAKQIFATGFVHADPHSGNIFVRKNKSSGKVEIVLLDHGLYEQMADEMKNDFCHFWEAIVLKDYDLMKKYSAKLNVKDHKGFAEILLQKPLEVNKFSMATKYTEEEVNYMKSMALKHFDLIMDILRDMPRSLLLVVRNLNTVRSIARDHGDVVDRPKVMARYAITCLLKSSDNFFQGLRRKVFFEYRLWKMFMQYWWMSNYLKMLEKIGRAPKDTSQLLNIKYD